MIAKIEKDPADLIWLEKMLAEVNREDIIECARLLAINLAEQLQENERVSLQDSFDQLHPQTIDIDAIDLRNRGRALLFDALRLAVRHHGADVEPISSDSQLRITLRERRECPRLAITVRIDVADTEGTWRKSGVLMDLAWGGAYFLIQERFEFAETELRLTLPMARGPAIEMTCAVVRTWLVEDGCFVAVRFTGLAVDDERRLGKMLSTLLKSQDSVGKREKPRLAQRIEIRYGDAQALTGIIEDISAGGMTLSVAKSTELQQSLQVVIGGRKQRPDLVLRARVMRQEIKVVDDKEVYQLALKFEHPNDDLKEHVQSLLQDLVQCKRDQEDGSDSP